SCGGSQGFKIPMLLPATGVLLTPQGVSVTSVLGSPPEALGGEVGMNVDADGFKGEIVWNKSRPD
ncbi:MAG TPA: hypothetical protein VLQ80_01980, partial [Candidatus Saccharimonadia bacterium]|nr:hypothetical protein [Candidatus Saccharimonadia bacterium]